MALEVGKQVSTVPFCSTAARRDTGDTGQFTVESRVRIRVWYAGGTWDSACGMQGWRGIGEVYSGIILG